MTVGINESLIYTLINGLLPVEMNDTDGTPVVVCGPKGRQSGEMITSKGNYPGYAGNIGCIRLSAGHNLVSLTKLLQCCCVVEER